MNIVQGTLTVESVEDVAHNTKKFIFRSQPDISFRAGQFLSLQFGETSWRAYSIASSPHEKKLEFVVRYVKKGLASEIWWRTKINDRFPFKGPFGNFLLSRNSKSHLVFCGTGTGIAPLRSMILAETQQPNPRSMSVLYGGKNAIDIAYLDEIASWNQNLQIYLGFSQSTQELPFQDANIQVSNNRITKFIPEFLQQKNTEFYICGNGEMVKSITEMLIQNNIEKTRIFLERFN
jgi:NAD(P)H-flavin reductase